MASDETTTDLYRLEKRIEGLEFMLAVAFDVLQPRFDGDDMEALTTNVLAFGAKHGSKAHEKWNQLQERSAENMKADNEVTD